MRPLLLAVALTAGLALGLWPLQTPPVAPADAPADRFSATRAMAHVEAVAHEPHPMGSAAHAAARAHVVAALQALGIPHEVQRATSVRSAVEYADFGFPPDLVYAARVENVVARLPGPPRAPVVLLTASYDSVPTSPGAGDNASSVAIVLETLRALQAGPAVDAEIVAVFADAEATGRLGAKAARAHPWLARADVVLAFGAMGTLGPTLLAQAGGAPAGMVGAVAQADRPLVSTAVAELLAATGQTADIGEYTAEGAASAFFASLDGWQANHTWLDRPPRLDRSGLQHAGDLALSTVRAIAADPRGARDGRAVVAFTAQPGAVVRYPIWIAWALAIAATAGWLVLAAWGVLRGAWTGPALITGAAQAVLVWIAALALPAVVWLAITAAFSWLTVFHSGTHGAWMLYMGWALVVPAVVWGLSSALRGRAGQGALHVGAAGGAVIVTWLLTVRAPGASYVVAIPLLLALLARAAVTRGVGAAWTPVAAAITGAAITVPVWALVAVTQKFQLLSGVSLMFLPLGPVALASLLVLPAVEWADGAEAGRDANADRKPRPEPSGGSGRRRAIVGALLFVALAEILSGLWLSRFTSARPRPDHMTYLLDADRGQAHWITAGASLDAWTSRFFADAPSEVSFVPSPGTFPDRGFPAFSGPAPRLNLASPEARVEEDRADGAGRVLAIRVRSARGAPDLQVGVTAAAPITAVAVDDVPVRPLDARTAGSGRLRVLAWAGGPDGIRLRLTLGGPGAVRLALADYSNGLPAEASPPSRPPDTMPAPFDWADPTEVRVTRTICGTPGCARGAAAP